ncbi:MAG: hypothetical protein AAFU60_08365 [Bacteroidota bacterium]
MKNATTFSLTLRNALVSICFLLITPMIGNSQTETISEDDLERTFMPTLQLGYVWHGTDELSAGLMTQTSIEYRDISNFIFRINYDAFNANMNLQYPIDEDVTFTGKTSFSDVIIGVGYRLTQQKHSFTAYVQPGIRFYGYPDLTAENNQVNLDYDSRNIGIIRYSVGYEFAITPKLFLAIEGLIGHTLRAVDFWTENRWAYGATIGLSAPIN